MGFYHDRIIPWLIHLSMRQPRHAPYRSRVVPAASGRVLEIGIGSGLNLPFYSNKVSELIGLDPSAKLLDMIRGAGGRLSAPLALIEGTAEAIPLDGRSVDTVVTTWTMCTIPEVQARVARYVSGPAAGWLSHLRGAWTCAGAACAVVAGQAGSSLEAPLGRLSPEPRNCRAH